MSGASLPLICLNRSSQLSPALLFAVGLLTFAVGASGQSDAGQTRFDRQLSYVDLALQGVGQFTKTVSGPITIPAVDTGVTVTQNASNTFGGLATLRYSPRPYLGVELNASYARYTENFSVEPLQIQTQANEFTFGYLITPPYAIFGLKPYASAGAGLMRFAPTRGGGQQAPSIGRPAYYYNVGLQKDLIPDRFGLRVGFRQVFFTAPDFYQNYLAINKTTSTTEPLVGFDLRF